MTVLAHEVATAPVEVPTVTSANQKTVIASAAAAVAGDVEAALTLADHHPAGEASVRLRERLREHVHTLAVPAERYAALLPESRTRTSRSAPCGSPARSPGIAGAIRR